MANENLKIRYDGPALDGHKIDVDLITPALSSLSTLFKQANTLINGDKTKIQVLINADIKANCVTLSFDIIQHVQENWKTLKVLLQDENVESLKSIIEWLFIGGGVLTVLKQIGKNKAPTEPTVIQQQINLHIDTVRIEHRDKILTLVSNKNIIQSLQGLVAPLVKEDGIQELTFQHDSKSASVDKVEAKEICSIVSGTETEDEVQPIIGHITVHSSSFDPSAKVWKFKYNGRVESIDISQTSISADILKRGKVVVGDTYKVKMEVREKKTKDGYKCSYRVAQVLDFHPGDEQMDLKLLRH